MARAIASSTGRRSPTRSGGGGRAREVHRDWVETALRDGRRGRDERGPRAWRWAAAALSNRSSAISVTGVGTVRPNGRGTTTACVRRPNPTGSISGAKPRPQDENPPELRPVLRHFDDLQRCHPGRPRHPGDRYGGTSIISGAIRGIGSPDTPHVDDDALHQAGVADAVEPLHAHLGLPVHEAQRVANDGPVARLRRALSRSDEAIPSRERVDRAGEAAPS